MVHTTIEDAFDTVLQYMNVTSRQCKVSYWKLCLVQKLPVPILLFAIKKVASRLLHCTIDHIVHAEVFRTFLYVVRVRQLFKLACNGTLCHTLLSQTSRLLALLKVSYFPAGVEILV